MEAFVSQLLQISHSQWIFKNYTFHNKQLGYLFLWERLEVLHEVHRLLDTAPANILKESQSLLELSHSTLYNKSYKRQAYWVLAIKVVRCAGWCTTVQERARGGSQSWRSIRVGARRVVCYNFSTLTSKMRCKLCLMIPTRRRSHSTLVLAKSASN
jgi:hypothetical protein